MILERAKQPTLWLQAELCKEVTWLTGCQTQSARGNMVNIVTILHNFHKNSQLLLIVTIGHDCHNCSWFSKLSQLSFHNCHLSKLVTVAKIGQNCYYWSQLSQLFAIFHIWTSLDMAREGKRGFHKFRQFWLCCWLKEVSTSLTISRQIQTSWI